MKITFYGAARTVTGSCYLLEYGEKKFLVDCGLFQGNKALKENNYREFPFNPVEIDFMILTHAHIDHCGLIPKLFLKGFKNNIYATSGTIDLAAILLPDCGHIQEMEVERKNRKKLRAGEPPITPIYTAADAFMVQPLFKAVKYDETFSPCPGISVTLRDAGHILGSAMVEIVYEEDGKQHKIVFSGDLGRYSHAIIKDPETITAADFLVIESTYGNRIHNGEAQEQEKKLTQIIRSTFAAGGNVIIPAFAVDRTQDILMMLHFIFEREGWNNQNVYVDSPLAVEATQIFANHSEYFDKLTTSLFNEKGVAPFILPNLKYVRSAEESMALNLAKSGNIIISASGMADAGRIKHHLKHNLWRKECSIIFIGYQAEGTLGRRITEGEKRVTILGEEVEVNANIYSLEGFSAHADKNELISWIGKFSQIPGKIFVTHGEESSAVEFADSVSKQYGVETFTPALGEIHNLTVADAFAASPEIQVEHDNKFTQTIFDESLLVDINTLLQKIAISNDFEKLYRVREYLRKIS